jgi:hypothetical protein
MLDLEVNGGAIEIRTRDDLRRMVQKEESVWQWLWGSRQPDVAGVSPTVQNGLNRPKSEINGAESSGQPFNVVAGPFREVFGSSTDSLFHSNSATGDALLRINEINGPAAAAFAYAFARQRVMLANAGRPKHLQGALLQSMPFLEKPFDIEQRLGLERANFRAALKTATERVEADSHARDIEWRDLLRSSPMTSGTSGSGSSPSPEMVLPFPNHLSPVPCDPMSGLGRFPPCGFGSKGWILAGPLAADFDGFSDRPVFGETRAREDVF